MNKLEVIDGLYRQTVYNVNMDGHYKHYTCYFNNDFSFFIVSDAGKNLNMTFFIENDNPEIINIPEDTKMLLIRALSEWTYNHIKPIGVNDSESIREIFKNPFDKIVAEKFKLFEKENL